jgi:hypothetical protein
MAKAPDKRLIETPPSEENAKITAAAKADPDARLLSKEQLEAMVPMRGVRDRPKPERLTVKPGETPPRGETD